MSINIQKAEDYLHTIIPTATSLSGEINATGTYLLFNAITVNNGFINDVTYHFNCYVAISNSDKNKGRIYDGLSQVLSNLLKAQQADQEIKIEAEQPVNSNKLIIYQLGIAVTPPLETNL